MHAQELTRVNAASGGQGILKTMVPPFRLNLRRAMVPRITRRDFLKDAGAAIAGVAIFDPGLSTVAAGDPPPVAIESAPAATPQVIALRVNGATREVAVEPQTTLAEVLRGPLGLTGTKIGCDRGACSACTVWVDGEPMLACMVLAVDVGDRRLVTIEGLARGDTLHPVQAAFIAHDAIQCGFCTPGMVMTCAALVEARKDLTGPVVKDAISGHLCRCGTTPHVVEAVLAAARDMES
jgi:xanthine dehydrogenase YagT iron-sulfur-binding subunit